MSDFNFADKIRKLMTLANHPGTGAAEAANAAAMAAQLALKHNIDMGKIRETEQSPDDKVFEHGAVAITIFGGDRQAVLYMASGLAALYGCSVLVTPHRKPSNQSDIRFVGQPHNIALCGIWLDYLWKACVKSNSADPEVKGIKGKPRYKADRSFRLYFGSAVGARLYEKLAAMQAQGIKDAESTSTALVVSNWYAQEQREVKAWMAQKMGNLGPVGQSSNRDLDVGAGMAGHAAGRKVGLDNQIGTRASASAGAISDQR